MHAQSINTTNTSRYSRLPPCGHLANTDTPMLGTLGKSPVETIIATTAKPICGAQQFVLFYSSHSGNFGSILVTNCN